MTWNDENLRSYIFSFCKWWNSNKINSEKGIYRNPSYSNNGKHIVYRKEGGNNEQGRTFAKNTGLYIMNADGSNQNSYQRR